MSLKRKPRITCPHCHAVYVLEKEGEAEAKVEDEGAEAIPEFYALPIRAHDWFTMFFRLRASTDRRRNVAPIGQPPKLVSEVAYSMLKAARNGEDGMRCPYAVRPTDEERDALVKIEVGSPAFEAWRKQLADEGYQGFGQDGSKWVWIPSEYPPRMQGESDDQVLERERVG